MFHQLGGPHGHDMPESLEFHIKSETIYQFDASLFCSSSSLSARVAATMSTWVRACEDCNDYLVRNHHLRAAIAIANPNQELPSFLRE